MFKRKIWGVKRMECESEIAIFGSEMGLHWQQENQYVKLHRRVKLMAMGSYAVLCKTDMLSKLIWYF